MAGIVKLALEVYQNSKSISESFLLLVYFVTISKASMALEPCANKTATWGIPEKSSEALTIGPTQSPNLDEFSEKLQSAFDTQIHCFFPKIVTKVPFIIANMQRK